MKKIDPNNVQVFLRFAVGMMSHKVTLPRHCLKEFRMPVLTDLKVADYRNVQDYIVAKPDRPILIFMWDGVSKINGIPVMDLKDFSR